MTKIALPPQQISDILCKYISDKNTIFVFPTDTVMNSWIDWLILNPEKSGVEALAFEQFLAWDTFKGKYVQAKKEGFSAVPSILRKFFVSDLIYQNSKKPEAERFQVIINPEEDFAANASSFCDWLSTILPSLYFWKKRLDENASEYGEADSEDRDYLYVYEQYKDFLEKNKLFEPSWLEETDISDKASHFIIFYPEILEDFCDYTGIFDKTDNVTIYTMPEAIPSPSVYKYSDSRKELRHTILRIIKLVKEGKADWSDITLNIPDIDTYRPYIDREFTQYRIPYIIRSGLPLTKNCAGRIFREISECYNQNFTFDSVRSLLLDECLPWKDEYQTIREELVREGNRMRCLCSPEEKDIWRQCFASKIARLKDGQEKERYTRLESFYNKLHKSINAFFINEEKQFSKIRESWMSFKSQFLKDDSDFSKEANNIIARCITELEELSFIQNKYADCALQIPDPYEFFLKTLDSKTYTPQSEKKGVNIYKYKLSAMASFKYQFVIDASQDGIEVSNKRLMFLNATKRARLGLIEDDIKQNATDIFIKLYAKNNPEDFVNFSFAEDSFAGFMISHSRLNEIENSELTEARNNELDEEDYIRKESLYLLGKTSFPEKITSLQKSQFERWIKINGQTDKSPYHINSQIEKRIEEHKTDNFLRISARGDLENYFPCPRKWVLKSLLKLHDDSLDTDLMQNFDMGNLNHKILELFFKDYEGKILPDVFSEELQASLKQKIIEAIKAPSDFRDSFLAIKTLEAQKDKIFDNISECIKTLIKPFPEGFGNCTVCGTEKNISVANEKKDFIWNGQIDLLLKEPSQKFIIVDYKTSKTPAKEKCKVNEDGILQDFQMGVYYKLTGGKDFETFEDLIYGGYFFSINEAKLYCITEAKEDSKYGPETFRETLAVIDEYGKMFNDSVSAKSFTPTAPSSHKDRLGVKIYEHCIACPCKTICRTTFTTGNKKLKREGK